MTESTSEYKKRIEEIKQSIENEPYMAKMREDIAEGISKTGIRQATVEEQFQSVLDETTGKDVISAPEVILARDGEANLKARLDKNYNEVTAQLAQKATKDEMDLKISRMQSGVKGTYATLSELETTLPNGDGGNYVVASSGHIYTWDGSNWADTGIQYQATGIARGSVSPAETTFFEQERINLFDKTKNTTPGIVVAETGGIVTTGALAPNFAASDYIAVNERETYEISYSGDHAGFAWYSEPTGHGYISGGYVTSTSTKHEAPTGARFLRTTFMLGFIDDAMVAKDTLPSEYVAYNDVKLSFQTPKQKESISQEVFSEMETEIKSLIPECKGDVAEQRFNGLLWSAVGDSITEKNFRATLNYHDYIKEQLEMTVDNQGYSGTGYLTPSGDSLKIPDRLDLIDTETDLITVMAGVNDIGKPLGEFGDTDKNVTLYGAIDYTLRTLIEKFPTKKIGVITPLPTSSYYGEDGNSLHLIANAVIETARKYSLPVLDLYRESGLRPWNTTNNATYFSTRGVPNGDGLHPNAEGHLFITYKILDFIKTL